MGDAKKRDGAEPPITVVPESEAYSETIKIKLGEGLMVDEMSEATNLNQPIGNYATFCEVKGDHLIFNVHSC